MTDGKIDHLIINTPYEEPTLYWKRDERTGEFFKESGRRPAGYVVANPESTSLDDPGRFIPIEQVEGIRPRVKRWRADGYPGASGTTRKLLEHWWNIELRRDMRRFFFCQLDAIETLIWLIESPASERTGIEIANDGGAFRRYCSKMATGSGKTIVMAMLIAWQALNKIADPQNAAYSKNFLIVAPGLTVRQRLQVLKPSDPANYYDEFAIVPPGLREKLYQAKVSVINWHALNWDSEEQIKKKRSVDKRGAKSDAAYTREVLKELGNAENIIVINDEAHHAWRITPDLAKNTTKDDLEEATVWVGGLDRIHRTRGILTAFDFSATPFVSTGHGGVEDLLFGWIVSDFGLNDAIESGLVKTPRVVIRDDGALDAENKSKFYRLYSHVREDLTRKEPETTPLPDLVKTAYTLLGKDWLEHFKDWKKIGTATPPVMITVANRTETAARIKYAFDKKKIVGVDELCEPDKTLHIDSKVLSMVENEEIQAEPTAAPDTDSENESEDDEAPKERKKTKKELALELREMVDTVGKPGKSGAMVRNVISVGMLTEGWDAKTVTHIMGLRAFSSQLLCEQVVGRGLRRTSYDVDPETGLFEAEYVNIFGIPFTFMPHEDTGNAPPKPTKPKFTIEALPERKDLEITFPNVLRIEQVFKPHLDLNLEQIPTLTLNAYDTPTIAELAPVLDGKADITRLSEISLQELGEKYRTQRIVFETAISVYEQMQADWKGNKEYLLGQVIAQVERFINSDKIQITPPLFYQDEMRRRLIITLNLSKVGEHIKGAIRAANTESLELVVDTDKPLRSTSDMLTWYTSKPWEFTKKSHINRVVFDSRWEATEAYELERNTNVTAWAKNDHLGFVVYYTYQGTHHTFYPDYLVRLSNGKTLVLEVKGQDDQRNRTKRQFLDEWIRAVNAHGGFGQWAWAVSLNPADLPDILEKSNQ